MPPNERLTFTELILASLENEDEQTVAVRASHR